MHGMTCLKRRKHTILEHKNKPGLYTGRVFAFVLLTVGAHHLHQCFGQRLIADDGVDIAQGAEGMHAGAAQLVVRAQKNALGGMPQKRLQKGDDAGHGD